MLSKKHSEKLMRSTEVQAQFCTEVSHKGLVRLIVPFQPVTLTTMWCVLQNVSTPDGTNLLGSNRSRAIQHCPGIRLHLYKPAVMTIVCHVVTAMTQSSQCCHKCCDEKYTSAFSICRHAVQHLHASAKYAK